MRHLALAALLASCGPGPIGVVARENIGDRAVVDICNPGVAPCAGGGTGGVRLDLVLLGVTAATVAAIALFWRPGSDSDSTPHTVAPEDGGSIGDQ